MPGRGAVELNLAATVIASVSQKFPWTGHFNGASLWAMDAMCSNASVALHAPSFNLFHHPR